MFYRKTQKRVFWEPRQTADTVVYSTTQAVYRFLLTLIVTVLFTESAFLCFHDVFNNVQISAESGMLTIFAVFPMIFFLEVICRVGPEFLEKLRFAVPIVYILALAVYFFLHQAEIVAGTRAIGECLINAFNYYYNLNMVVSQSSYAGTGRAFCFWVTCLLAIAVLEAYWSKKRLAIGILPLLVLVLDLLVGFAPQINGMVLGIAGILCANAGEWQEEDSVWAKEERKRDGTGFRLILMIIIIITIIMIPLTGNIFFRDSAEKLVSSGINYREFQSSLERKFWNYISFLPFVTESEHVNNHAPDYENKEVLRLSVSQKPQENLYLRGFYGTDYINGTWENQADEFDQAWMQAGFTEEEIESAYSLQISYKDPIEYQLSYTDLKSKKLFAPTMLILDSIDIDHEISGEYLLYKNRNEKQILFEVWNMTTDELKNYDTYKTTRGSMWYTVYVYGHQLAVPERVESAGSIAEQIMDLYGDQAVSLLNDPNITDPFVRKDAILEAADQVSRYLSSWEYSLELNRVPNGMDAVEYFLAESHAGYCMHYASAGVMILRKMGVPARYASGYIAKKDHFVKEGEQYTISILDSDAHAWVEVYLEGIGWIPVEMTPGYAAAATETSNTEVVQKVTADAQLPETQQDAAAQNGSKQDSQKQKEQEISQNNKEEGKQKVIDPADQNEEVGEGSGIVGGLGFGEQKGKIPHDLFLVGAIVFLVLAGMAVFLAVIMCRKKHWLLNLRIEITSKRNRRAVKMINTRIYRKLRRKAHFLKKEPNDAEYENLLKQYFPKATKEEWEEYMKIVTKAVFSRNKILDLEAAFCQHMFWVVFSS